MDFVAKKGEVIVLDGGSSAYQVIKNLVYNDENYLVLMPIPSKVSTLLSEENVSIKFAKEVVENGDYFIDEVIDKKMNRELMNLVKNSTKK
jgi:hypothetical protein